jgi:hypothetical protein
MQTVCLGCGLTEKFSGFHKLSDKPCIGGSPAALFDLRCYYGIGSAHLQD